MIRISKSADERREAGAVECWLLHGAVGSVADWRGAGKQLAGHGVGTRAVDLWRFLDCGPMSLAEFGAALSAEAAGEVFRGTGRVLCGYSMGGRLALHALLADPAPWQAAVIISAHPGIGDARERAARQAADADWAAGALMGDWAAFLKNWDAQPVLAGGAVDDSPARAARLMQRRREIARSFVDWSLGAQEPLWERLAGIRIPVLWITGADDPKFTALARRAAGIMPDARHRVIDGAGHRVPWHNESAFCQALASFTRTGTDAGDPVIDVACLVLIDTAGRVLAAKRPPHKPLGGLWEFPGGKIHRGESPETALRRELREELALDVGTLDPMPAREHRYPFGIIRLWPLRACCDGPPHPELTLHEHTEIRWVDASAARQLDWAPADVPVLHEHFG